MSCELHALATLPLVKELVIAIVDTLLGGWASGLVWFPVLFLCHLAHGLLIHNKCNKCLCGSDSFHPWASAEAHKF